MATCRYQPVQNSPLTHAAAASLPCSLACPAVVHIDGSAPPLQYGIDVPKSATVG